MSILISMKQMTTSLFLFMIQLLCYSRQYKIISIKKWISSMYGIFWILIRNKKFFLSQRNNKFLVDPNPACFDFHFLTNYFNLYIWIYCQEIWNPFNEQLLFLHSCSTHYCAFHFWLKSFFLFKNVDLKEIHF